MRKFLGMLIALAMGTVAAAQTPPAPAVPAADPQNILYLDLSNGGRVAIAMRPDKAPAHVERLKTLVRQGFYDGTLFHRVIEGFMAQGGDPTATGQGGSKLPDLKAEFNDLPHLRGTTSMARAESPDSGNSQFFIMFAPRFSLDGKYTVWGRVISGMQYVDSIERGEPPANPTKILKASIAADNVPPPPPQAVQVAPAKPTIGTVPLPPSTAAKGQSLDDVVAGAAEKEKAQEPQ